MRMKATTAVMAVVAIVQFKLLSESESEPMRATRFDKN